MNQVAIDWRHSQSDTSQVVDNDFLAKFCSSDALTILKV
jgi:hypothetical protein